MKSYDTSTKKFFKIKKDELCEFITEFKNEHWWQSFPVSRGAFPFVIEIPDEVKVIKENAFIGLRGGINGKICVKIPSGVERIEKNAFSGAEIDKLYISETVSFIHSDAFRLSKIAEIEVDKANHSFKSENGCLYNYDLTVLLRYAGEDADYTLLPSVEVIGKRAFENSVKLECIFIPDNVVTIQDGAFYNSGIKSVSGAARVSKMGQHVFALCKNLTTFMMPNDITFVNHRMFYGCESLEKITLSRTTTQIGEEAFYLCTALGEIELPEDLKMIGKGAFEGCRALRTVNLPEGVTAIEERTFKGCAFSEVVVSDVVKRIETEAFADCQRMKIITIGTAVENMNERVFYGCQRNLIVVLKGKEKEKPLPYHRNWDELSEGIFFKKRIKNVAYVSANDTIKNYM